MCIFFAFRFSLFAFRFSLFAFHSPHSRLRCLMQTRPVITGPHFSTELEETAGLRIVFAQLTNQSGLQSRIASIIISGFPAICDGLAVKP
jgi:hypothetical protein